jgi:streptomycin 6-kinase
LAKLKMSASIDESLNKKEGWHSWNIPEDFIDFLACVHGKDAVYMWLDEVSALAEECSAKWQLKLGSFIPGGALSCVLACEIEHRPAVLKFASPWSRADQSLEGAALAAWCGIGAAKLLAQYNDGQALLLERVIPGTTFFASNSDAEDCQRVAENLRALAAASPPLVLPDLTKAVKDRFRDARLSWATVERKEWLTEEVFERAEQNALMMVQSTASRQLLHGDYQNKNLLLGPAGLLVAIDPTPAVGDSHYDPALWALTHRPGERVRERCAELAKRLLLDPERLWQWCIVLAVPEIALDYLPRALAQLEYFKPYL